MVSSWNIGCLSACKKSTSSLPTFLRYCKDITHLLFQVFSTCLAMNSKNDTTSLQKILCLASCQKSYLSFFKHYKLVLQICYFGYNGHAWPHKAKAIAPTCRKLWYLSANKKSTWYFNFFKRYYTLQNSAIWLVNYILGNYSRTRILTDRGFETESQKLKELLFDIASGKDKLQN